MPHIYLLKFSLFGLDTLKYLFVVILFIYIIPLSKLNLLHLHWKDHESDQGFRLVHETEYTALPAPFVEDILSTTTV